MASLVRWWKIMTKIFGFFWGNFIFLHVSHQVRGLWELFLRIWFCFQQNPNLHFIFGLMLKNCDQNIGFFSPQFYLSVFFSSMIPSPDSLPSTTFSVFTHHHHIIKLSLVFSVSSLRERNDHEPFILTSKIDLVLQHVHTALVFPVSQCVEKGCNSAYYWV